MLEAIRGLTHASVSVNLYSKDIRFVFELIQNAEDNRYERAPAEDTEPYITFTVCHNSIVVDSNEDGFRDADVEAICNVGKSTKKVSRGYVGEKGIGFKTVFKVADRVRIQSGPFSFSFQHRRGDNPMGMITPHNEDHQALPQGIRTGIILTLSESAEVSEVTQGFRDLPDTLLLFLTKIKKIIVNVSDPSSNLQSETTYSYQCDHGSAMVKLTKVCSSGALAEETTTLYHITRRQILNLPEDDLRPLTNQAEVVLAFPVDEKDEPVIEQQEVYAFLPLRRVGFSVS